MANLEAWSDEPINGIEEDTFGRKRFAQLLAEAIDEVPIGAPSTVFGLVGPWGSGKSSVASMVGKILPNSWVTQSFTPWAASGTAALQLEFVAALDTAVGGGLAEDDATRTALRKYAKWASPVLAAIPGVGKALSGVGQLIVDEATARQPWSVEFEALAELLRTMGKRVLIVCDDIDRLDAVELLEFLKVVRLLGRFPNVHYLVAYDADTVEDLLAAEGIRGRTSSFMEKIVQHPFELPQIDRATRWRHISKAVSKSLDAQGVRLNESGMERYRLLIDTLTTGLVTPRQIARYENHLNVLTQLVPGEVDFLDFAALANLRLNHHEIYEALPEWAPQLRAGFWRSADEEEVEEGKTLSPEDWIKLFRDTSRRADITGAWESVRFLFPKLQDWRNINKPPHPQAFSDSRYSERYYSLGVPEDDISDVIVSRAIAWLMGVEPDDAAEEALSKISSSAHPSIARLAFEKLREHRQAYLQGFADGHRVTKLVTFLLSEYRRLEDSRNDPETAVDLIFDWLAAETLLGFSTGELTRGQLLELFGEDLCLTILHAINRPLLAGQDTHNVEKMLLDFANHFLDALDSQEKTALEPLESLRLRLSLISRAKGTEAIAGLLDPIVDGDTALFESAAIAMVRTESWHGDGSVRQNLSFETKEWTIAVSAQVRERMAASLTEEFDSQEIDYDDIASPNRRRVAIRSVRSEFRPGKDAASG
ncbi:P-loop NTPase fold protein [Arthrobacter sulfonylureivorans]|uniref:KAP family P-loop NTPase fold protein n=1 Tax=Arthrobacter sulfonylureivorans TaxID=2486855 RepID=UPI0039E51285